MGLGTKSTIWLLGGLGALAVAAGCSSTADDAAGNGGANLTEQDPVTELAELDKVLGHDRVGRVLHANLTSISSKLPDNENLFGVGRACNSAASKEIFIVEEKSTRFGGRQQDTLNLLPRAVIGGCNQAPLTSSHLGSFELMIAAVSDKDYPLDDPFSVEPVEIMALDDDTGLFNFYIIERPEPLHPHDRPTVTRFDRRADGQIMRYQKIANRPAMIEVSSNRKCFDCHVNGGPVMNELTQPWSGWISSTGLYSRPSVTGLSRDLISEARPFNREHNRSSLANDLERITREAIQTWIEGQPTKPGSGLGPQTLAGKQPGGVSALLKSTFCQTELNFASTFDTIPLPMFVDEFLGNFASLEPPINSIQNPKFPVRLPVRSEVDKRIEVFLQKKGQITPDTVLAARLVDDEHDVFSTARCGLYPSVVAAIAGGATPEAASRAAIATTIAAGANTPREKLIAAILNPKTTDDERSKAESDYIADLTARYNADITKVESPEGLKELDDRLAAKQKAAQAMFPSTANVLPRLEHVPSIFVPEAP